MREYRLSEEAEAELDGIWLFIARDSGSLERATRVVEDIVKRFGFLAEHPYAGRTRERDLEPGLRSFPVGRHVIIYQIQPHDQVASCMYSMVSATFQRCLAKSRTNSARRPGTRFFEATPQWNKETWS